MPSIGGPASTGDDVVNTKVMKCPHWDAFTNWDITVMFYESGNVRVVCPTMLANHKCPGSTAALKCPTYLDYAPQQ